MPPCCGDLETFSFCYPLQHNFILISYSELASRACPWEGWPTQLRAQLLCNRPCLWLQQAERTVCWVRGSLCSVVLHGQWLCGWWLSVVSGSPWPVVLSGHCSPCAPAAEAASLVLRSWAFSTSRVFTCSQENDHLCFVFPCCIGWSPYRLHPAYPKEGKWKKLWALQKCLS